MNEQESEGNNSIMEMTTNLENLKESLKMKKFYNMAEYIIKYQKFKSSVALTKMNNLDISNSTKINYFNFGVAYLKTGNKHRALPSTLYACIDELVAKHVQPLIPKIEEERQEKNWVKKFQKKEAVLPVSKLEIVNKPLTTNIEYGVKSNNNIMLMPSRDYALEFLAGLKKLNPNKEIEAKVVTVELGELSEENDK